MIGTYIKFRIIQYLQNVTVTNTVIHVDDLILFEQKVNLINAPLIFMQLLRILFPFFMKDILGNIVFVSLWASIGAFALFHRAIGGLGIAGVRQVHLHLSTDNKLFLRNDLCPNRVLCIKFHNIVLKIGATRLINCICCLTFSLSLIFGIGHIVESFILAPEVAFFRDLRPPPNGGYLASAIFTRIAFTTCLLFNVVEFIFYVIIFLDMYKHHKQHVKLCLSNKPKLASSKKRQNTITTVGHFASWVAEILIFCVIQYVLAVNRDTIPLTYWIFLRVLLPSINYVVFPLVQAMTSQDLRSHVFSLDYFKEVYVHVNCMLKRNGEAAVAEEVELHALHNGHIHVI